MELHNMPESKLQEASAPVADRARFKALVVEDDATSRLMLHGLMSRYGECHIALNGKEALEAFHSARQAGNPFDLICMDIQMPEMDGQEAVSQIRATELKDEGKVGVKILMTTSVRNVKTILASYAAKCDGYLMKPLDGKRLEERLRALGLMPE